MLSKAECRAVIEAARAKGVDFGAFGGRVVTAKGHFLSEINSFLCMYQAQENSVRVGGFRQWREVGRKVRKGAHALAIYLPAKRRAKTEGPGAESAEAERTEGESGELAGDLFAAAAPVVAAQTRARGEDRARRFFVTAVFAWRDTEPLDAGGGEAAIMGAEAGATALTEAEADAVDISAADLIEAQLEEEEDY